MLNKHALNQIANRISPMFASGAYTVDGVQKKVPIFRKEIDQEKSVIRVYLYLTDEHTGNFSEFKLLDENDNVIDTEPYEITKDEYKGMVIAFKYQITAERLFDIIDKEV